MFCLCILYTYEILNHSLPRSFFHPFIVNMILSFSQWIFKMLCQRGVPTVVQRVKDPRLSLWQLSSLFGADLIPSLVKWVKDRHYCSCCVGHSCSWNSIPALGTSKCCSCSRRRKNKIKTRRKGSIDRDTISDQQNWTFLGADLLLKKKVC